MLIEKMHKITEQNNNNNNNNNEEESFVPLENSKEVLKSVSTPSFMASLDSSFEASSPPPMSFFGCFSRNKRVSQDQTETDDSRGDRRHKRMMKNRESAARSRARRQAYTSELEREIVELKEENANLRKCQIELLLSIPAGTPKKNTHNRSMTAPF
ncbi:hypothetical protein RND81_03G007100 [Saponaria officinalis]|uniref:BZIP domain-containing protein n=1 Tax=Saponaria officinalis TaxID=3572 RepID=A0AAW1LY09_SAPOF